jgi:hypothetical protein
MMFREMFVQYLRSLVTSAFEATHDGWSSDEVILNSELNEKFIAYCQSQLPEVKEKIFNWTLINMRKAGQLKIPTTKRNLEPVGHLAPLAEIAARHVCNRHNLSVDQIMCDPKLRSEFDEVVNLLASQADKYSVRKAAFYLRKQNRRAS